MNEGATARLHRTEDPPTGPIDWALGLGQIRDLEAYLTQVIQGKEDVVRLALVAVLARGHLLLEDVPGVGKTTLGLALATALGCSFSRIQFTSDLLPTDILGVAVFNQQTAQFDFRFGPLFSNVVLADELNRTTPKTQSCLLEAMSEGKASIDGETHLLPAPFLVIATQNPLEHHGTFPLPESQLDRFLMRIRVGYPDPRAERHILRGVPRPSPGEDASVLTPAQVHQLQEAVTRITVDEALEDYLLAIVRMTRESPRLALGVSPRGAQFLYRAAQALAYVEGRRYCIPDDIKRLSLPVLAHRIVPAGMVGLQVLAEEAEGLLEALMADVPAPRG